MVHIPIVRDIVGSQSARKFLAKFLVISYTVVLGVAGQLYPLLTMIIDRCLAIQ